MMLGTTIQSSGDCDANASRHIDAATVVHEEHDAEVSRDRTSHAMSRASPSPIVRHGYAPPASRHGIALAGLALLAATVVAIVLVTVSERQPVRAPSAPLVVDLLPLSTPVAPPEDKPAPKPVRKVEPPARPRPTDPVVPAHVLMPAPAPAPHPLPSVQKTPPLPETAAPPPAPPPAATASAKAPDSWEGRVLARLNAFRRYPPEARARQQEGVPYVRILIDRQGRVLSARIDRSCGYASLDREATALARRAQPLPAPPPDRPGDTVELVVPVEFFLQ